MVSAFGCFDVTYPDAAQQNTLFMTRARTDNNIQSSPWPRYIASAQGTTRAKVDGAGYGGNYIGASLPAAVNTNQPNYLIEAEASNISPTFSYNSMLGVSGNWGGFGITEQATSSTFTTRWLAGAGGFILDRSGRDSHFPSAVHFPRLFSTEH